MPFRGPRGAWLIIAAAVLFSTSGAAIKAATLSSSHIAGLRSLIAACAILLLIPASRPPWQWRYVPVAAAYGATLVLFVMSTKLTTAANAIFLQSTAPLFVMALAPALLKERVRRSDALFMAVLAFGMALFFAAGERAIATAPEPARGNMLALASAVTFALSVMGVRWLSQRRGANPDPGLASAAMGNLMAAGSMLLFTLPLPQFDWKNALILLWLGIFQIGLGYVCFIRGIRTVSALDATTLILLEPALNPVWTWLVHGEKPAPLALTGGAIVLTTTLLRTWWQRRH